MKFTKPKFTARGVIQFFLGFLILLGIILPPLLMIAEFVK